MPDMETIARENADAVIIALTPETHDLARAVVHLARRSKEQKNAHLRPAVAFLVAYLELEASTR